MNKENKKPENPYAFPIHPNTNTDKKVGMTLRDYFANSAMQAVISNQSFLKTILSHADEKTISCDAIAKNAYTMADAMLKQREL